MELRCVRKIFTKRTTISDLYIDGLYEMHVLEDCVREIEGQPVEKWKIPHVTAIPYGTYDIVWDWSNRFKRNMIHILNVPGFEGIRIHSGNQEVDTDGCLIVGDTILNNDYIYNSKPALMRLERRIQSAFERCEMITIEITKEDVCANG